MGKFTEDNESKELFPYSTDVLKYGTSDYLDALTLWERKGENTLNPWNVVAGLELEMSGTDPDIEYYSSLLNFGLFSEDSTVDAEFKSLPFPLSKWLYIIATNRESFNNYLRTNQTGNDAGLHIHLSRFCVPDKVGVFLHSFFNIIEEDSLSDIAGRLLPNNYADYTSSIESPSKYGLVTKHKSGKTFEIRIFQSPDNWEDLIRAIYWVAKLVKAAYHPYSEDSTWQGLYNQISDEVLVELPQLISNLSSLELDEDDIDIEDYDEEEFYDPVTGEVFYNEDDYIEEMQERVRENPYKYMRYGFFSIKDLYNLGETSIYLEEEIGDIWVSNEFYNTVVLDMEDEIKEFLYEELWDYLVDKSLKDILKPMVSMFFTNHTNPYQVLETSLWLNNYHEELVIEGFVDSFLSLEFPSWYLKECEYYHQDIYRESFTKSLYPTEEQIYTHLREAIGELVARTIRGAWKFPPEQITNSLLGVTITEKRCDLYPMLPLDFGEDEPILNKKYELSQVVNALGIPSRWFFS